MPGSDLVAALVSHQYLDAMKLQLRSGPDAGLRSGCRAGVAPMPGCDEVAALVSHRCWVAIILLKVSHR